MPRGGGTLARGRGELYLLTRAQQTEIKAAITPEMRAHLYKDSRDVPPART